MLSNFLEKKNYKKPDFILLGIAGTIICVGILILASVSTATSYQLFGDTYYFLKHQLLFGIIPGLVLGYLAYRFNLSLLKKYSFIILIIAFVLMLLVFIPQLSLDAGGAKRWVALGPFTFQPSEFLKIAFIIYLATWLKSRSEKKFSDLGQTFFAFLLVMGAIALLFFFQKDASTLGVIVIVAAIMYFSTETPIKHTLLISLLGLTSLAALIKLAPFRMNRLLVFLNPDIDPMGIGYQLNQSKIAVGSGGIFGVGLGMSTQKFGYLPQTISDSIFAIFSEETGFLGAVSLILLFLFFAWRGFRIASRVNDRFFKLLALGISSWIIIQTFVNIGAMIGILPLTGIPLPFISYGGTALIAEMISLGILLNISRHAN